MYASIEFARRFIVIEKSSSISNKLRFPFLLFFLLIFSKVERVKGTKWDTHTNLWLIAMDGWTAELGNGSPDVLGKGVFPGHSGWEKERQGERKNERGREAYTILHPALYTALYVPFLLSYDLREKENRTEFSTLYLFVLRSAKNMYIHKKKKIEKCKNREREKSSRGQEKKYTNAWLVRISSVSSYPPRKTPRKNFADFTATLFHVTLRLCAMY